MGTNFMVSSGNTTLIATDSVAGSAAHYQIIKIADGTPSSGAMVSASVLYGLQTDVTRIAAGTNNIGSIATTVYNTPSVTIAGGTFVNASIGGIASVACFNGLNVNASISGTPSVTIPAGLFVNASIGGIASVALLANPSVVVSQMFGTPSVTANVFNTISVATHSVTAAQVGTWSVALFANPSVTAILFGTPSVAPTTHSVTIATGLTVSATLLGTPSVAVMVTPSVGSIDKFLIITATQVLPTVLWSNVATTRWCLTDLMISSQYSTTVTMLDGTRSIARFHFAADGGAVSNFSTPWKSTAVGQNIMITTAGTGSVTLTAVGYEVS